MNSHQRRVAIRKLKLNKIIYNIYPWTGNHLSLYTEEILNSLPKNEVTTITFIKSPCLGKTDIMVDFQKYLRK
jgi:phage terminase large subunit GpA-like protein